MLSEVDKQKVVARLLRGQGDANLLKKEIEEGSAPTESLIHNILDCFSFFISFMISSDHPPPQHESSQNIADPVPSSSLKLKKKICRKEVLEHYRVDSPFPLVNDGFSWRKYGQKKIKNSVHTRNYYRCSYKEERNCQAKRHVQKIQDNPSLYTNIYHGQHMCKVPVFSYPTNEDITHGSKMIVFEKLDQVMPESTMPQLVSVDLQETVKDQTMNQECNDEDQIQAYELPLSSPGDMMTSLENVSAFLMCDVPVLSHRTNGDIIDGFKMILDQDMPESLMPQLVSVGLQEIIKDQTMNQEWNDEHEKQFQVYESPKAMYFENGLAFHKCDVPVFSHPTNDDITEGSKMVQVEKLNQVMPESVMPQLVLVDHQETIKDQTMNQECNDEHEDQFRAFAYELPPLSPGDVFNDFHNHF